MGIGNLKIIKKSFCFFGSAILGILFLYSSKNVSTRAYANEVSPDSSTKIKNVYKNPFNNGSFGLLREVPRQKINNEERKLTLGRNPFTPIQYEGQNGNNYLSSKIIFTGIAKVGDSKVVFGQTGKGLTSLPLGFDLGNGFSIVNIDIEKSEVKISNGVQTYKYEFNVK